MLVDLHMHTSAISSCCKIEAEENIILTKKYGFDGGVITNHYVASYFDEDTYDEWIERYIAEWNVCRELGKKHNFRIFCGVEVTLVADSRLHMLIYGADESFLRKNARLCNMPLQELYRVCKENGCALVQAHPFRAGATIQDMSCLDGVEISCHPIYKKSYWEKLIAAAKENELAVTVGCDYHHDSNRPSGGMILSEEIGTDQELAEYLLNANTFTLKIHEPENEEIFVMEYERRK